MAIGTVRLSKSKFLSGLQCHKRLYLAIHSPELATEPDAESQAILDMGTAIGELARKRFSGGILVDADHRHRSEALKRTAELVNDPSVPAIFEGAFEFDQVLVRVDILERVSPEPNAGYAWRLIEVKSSSRVKDVHVHDLAVQAHVLGGCGFLLSSACLMHINTEYVYRGGDLDLGSLFAIRDVSQSVADRQAEVQAHLAGMKAMLLVPQPPSIQPDSHCHTPHVCPFWEHCTKEKPARWVYHLPGRSVGIEAFARQGIQTIDEIPPTVHLTSNQQRMKDNVEWIGPQLKTALESVRYPVHHLDFETFMPAIPRFRETRPYQVIPTQWSNHIMETGDGEVRHEEYLCDEAKDPREELAQALLGSVGAEGSICVYSGYEQAMLRRLAESLPALREELLALTKRLWDLLPIIQRHYYHPAFNGSYSIKSVLPALAPALGYDDLEIQAGGVAAQLYDRMVFHETDWVEKVRIREALLSYCKRDTLALVHLRKVLFDKALNIGS